MNTDNYQQPGPYQKICPACGELAEAEHVHNGVGMVQVEPFHCYKCQWFEGGKMDEILSKLGHIESLYRWRSIAVDGLPGEGSNETMFVFITFDESNPELSDYGLRSRESVHRFTDEIKCMFTHWFEVTLSNK